MAPEYFKTSARRRELSAETRRRRKVAGKPVQPAIVDEALSAAIQAATNRNVRASNAGKLVSPYEIKVYDTLLAAAIDHLVAVKGLDREQSKSALQFRLLKRRQYKTLLSRKG